MGYGSVKFAFVLSLITSAACVISACGSDDEEPSGNAGTGAGATGGASGSGGRGGASGSTGTGGGGASGTGPGGTGGAGGNQPVPCGTKMCQPGGLGFIPACCLDAATEKCGIDPPQLTVDGGDLPCTEVNQPGTPDSKCFADQGIDLEDAGIDAAGFIDGGRLTIPGCCRPNGMCGIMLDFPQLGLSLGCIDPEQYGAIYDAGPPQRCGDGGGGTDASTDSSTSDSSSGDSSTGD